MVDATVVVFVETNMWWPMETHTSIFNDSTWHPGFNFRNGYYTFRNMIVLPKRK